MARSEAGRRLTEAHRRSQIKIGAETVARLVAAWKVLDGEDLDGSLTEWLRVAVPVVGHQRWQSARVGASYFAAFRAVEIGPGTFAAQLVGEVDPRRVVTSLTLTGPVFVKSAMARGVKLERAMAIGASMSASAGMRHALDGGRETIFTSVRADSAARGWARVTSGRACAFCAMLASRGAVYKTDTVKFRSHDHCTCTAEPVFGKESILPPGAERLRDLWDESTGGLSQGEAIDAFRRAYDAQLV